LRVRVLVANEVAPDRRRIDVIEMGEVDVVGLPHLEQVLDRERSEIVKMGGPFHGFPCCRARAPAPADQTMRRRILRQSIGEEAGAGKARICSDTRARYLERRGGLV